MTDDNPLWLWLAVFFAASGAYGINLYNHHKLTRDLAVGVVCGVIGIYSLIIYFINPNYFPGLTRLWQ